MSGAENEFQLRMGLTHAGPDQVLEATGSLTDVVLDGSATSDPDISDVLTYNWSGSFGSATGASPIVFLGLGIHNILLTVDYSDLETATDFVMVTVEITRPDTIIIFINEMWADGRITNRGIKNNLLAKLEDAQTSLDSGDVSSAISALRHNIALIEAQRDTGIVSSAADELTQYHRGVLALLQ